MRFRLRTLLILVGIVPPLLAFSWWLPALPSLVVPALAVAWEFRRLRPNST